MEEVNSGGTRLVDGAKAITQSFDFHAEVSLIFGYKLHGFTDATHVDRDGVFGHWFSVCVGTMNQELHHWEAMVPTQAAVLGPVDFQS